MLRAASAAPARSSWPPRAPPSPSTTAPTPTAPRPSWPRSRPREAAPWRFGADVAVAEEAHALVARCEDELGEIDALVCNAGITRDNLIARISTQDFDDVIATNLGGAFHVCQAAARRMLRRRRGSIVTMSSIVGIHGNAGQTNYSASKAGLIGLTKSLAKEIGSRGVRVNCIAPGYIATELTDVLPESAREALLASTPLGRLGEPEDVARCVRFLASDASSFVTGAVLAVDGGLGM